MVRLSRESAVYTTRDPDDTLENLIGVVLDSKKREVHSEKGSLGLMTEIKVVDIVEVMWNNGTVQTVDGRWLIKITARSIREENSG